MAQLKRGQVWLWVMGALLVSLRLNAPPAPTQAAGSNTIFLPLIRQSGIPPVNVTALLGEVVTTTVTLENNSDTDLIVYLSEGWEPALGLARPQASQPMRVPLPDLPGPLTVELQQQLAAEGQADMLIYLNEQADLSAAASISDWNARGAAVVNLLKTQAELTQTPLLEALRARGLAPRSFWIVNALSVRGDLALAQWLTQQPEVGLVAANTQHAIESLSVTSTALDETAWGVTHIGAESVWADWGVRGESLVIANIDTGVMFSHTALLEPYRGWSPIGLVHHYNWFDPGEEPTTEPTDDAGHGTHTMGIMVGQATTTTAAIGVAPGARWIAARGCASVFCSDYDLMASAQWMLAPTDLQNQNPRPDLRPHLINNSWAKIGDDPWYTGYVEAWNAAGIFSVFANGNAGLAFGCSSSGAPANYANAVGVGATDTNDVIADFSSRGPTLDGRIKPDLSAPGVNVPSAWSDGSIVLASGTSMAAPHVAGAVALLWSANPTLMGDLPATQNLITATAAALASSECGDAPGAIPNNVYGWGRLDVRAAVEAARVDVPWVSGPPTVTLPAYGQALVTLTFDARQVTGPGDFSARLLVNQNNTLQSASLNFTVLPTANIAVLSGQLLDRWNSANVYGRVSIGNGPAAYTDLAGAYTLTLPYGTYTLTATATGYLSESVALSLTADLTWPLTLTLDAPHLLVSAPPLSATLPFGAQQLTAITVTNAGPQPLDVTLSVPPLEWSFAEDLPAAALYDVSAFPALPLADDMIYSDTLNIGFTIPIYGVITDHVYLSSNGWVSAYPPLSAASWALCLPTYSLPQGSLAPFWADLDPSQGGAVRAGRVTSDTFVVSFENVPPWRPTPDPLGPTFAFQLALHSDGRAQFIYGDVSATPGKWSAGLAWDINRAQGLACNLAPLALTGRSWSFRNQPLPSLWLSAAPLNLTLSANTSQIITATLNGFGYVPWRALPFEGVIRLNTNDPRQLVADIPATALVGSPPYTMWLPVTRR